MDHKRNHRLLHIYSCRGIGVRTIEKMVSFDPTLEMIFLMTQDELSFQFNMTENNALNFYNDIQKPLQELLKIDPDTCAFITRFDKEYPPLLKEIYDPPWVLFYKGDLALLHEKRSLAVVGSRYPTEEAEPIMQQLLHPLIQKGWCIVSGLAYGIDAIGHRVTLEAKGKTIAVLGSGIEVIYPKQHIGLAQQIAEEGLILSEFLPKQQPARWQFPLRNRIISGLTKGTLVVEAKERSGSLITADQALEQGREVFAVPGSIQNENSKGTNYLIQQGAKLVRTAEDIENEFPFDKQ